VGIETRDDLMQTANKSQRFATEQSSEPEVAHLNLITTLRAPRPLRPLRLFEVSPKCQLSISVVEYRGEPS
jgi:hypothetical protein